MKSHFLRYTFHAIGPILFIVIIWKVDISQICSTLNNSDFKFVFLAIIFSAIGLFLRVFRWNKIKDRLGIGMNYRESVLVTLMGNCFGAVTPGRLGLEGFRLAYLKRGGRRGANIILSLMLNRVYDALPIVIGGLLGAALFLSRQTNTIYWFFFTFIAGGLIGILFKDKLKIIVFKYLVRSHETQNIIQQAMQHHFLCCSRYIGMLLTISIAGYLSSGMMVYCLAHAIHLPVSYGYLLWCFSVMTLVNYIPISVLGIGSRDMTLIFLLSRIGIDSETTVSLSMLILGVLVFYVFLGMNVFLVKRLKSC